MRTHDRTFTRTRRAAARAAVTAVLLLLGAAAARARAAAPTCDVFRDSTIAGGDALAAAAMAELARNGVVVDTGRRDVLDGPADLSPLFRPGSPYFADPATRPAPADGDLACCLLADELSGRDAVRIVVVDRRTRCRLRVERLLRSDAAFDAEAIATAVRSAIEKSRETATAHVVVAPTIVADVDRASAPAARLATEAIEAALLDRPGVFLVESELLRRVAPTPAMDAAPRTWPGDGPWVVTSEYEPRRGVASTTRPARPRSERPRIVRDEAPDQPGTPRRADAEWPGPGTLRVAVARAGATTRESSADVDAPDAIALAGTRLARAIELAPPAAPPADESAVADAAARLMTLGEFAAASGLYEVAVARQPASFALRTSTMIAHLRTNRPAGSGFGQRFITMTVRTDERDAATAIDRAAGVHARALAHLKATVDAPRPAEPRLAGPDDDLFLRSIFEPFTDPRVPDTYLQPTDAVAPPLRRYRDALAAMWMDWADERVAAGEMDETLYLGAALSTATPEQRRDVLIAFAVRHADAADLGARLAAYSALSSRQPGRFVAPAVIDGRATVGPRVPPAPFFATLAAIDDPRIQAGVRDARAIFAERAEAAATRATSRPTSRPTTTRAATSRPSTTRAAVDVDESSPPDVTFDLIARPTWNGPVAAGDRDVVWSGQTIWTLAADGSTTTTTPLLADVEPPAASSPIDRVAFDGRYLWATIRRSRTISAAPALIVLDPATGRHRVIRAADGLPPTNGTSMFREAPFVVLAPLGPGEVAVAGASDRAWVATVRVDDELRPTVDLVARLDHEPLTERANDDPRANLAPEAVYAVAPDAAGRPTQLIVARYPLRSPPVPRGPVGTFNRPPTTSLLVSLGDRSLAVIETPALASDDRTFTHAGRLFCLVSDPTGGPGTRGLALRRYDPTRRAFDVVASFDNASFGGGAAMRAGDRFIVGNGDALWLADAPDGPYRRLNRPLPTPANGSTAQWIRAAADGRLIVRWGQQAWWATIARPIQE